MMKILLFAISVLMFLSGCVTQSLRPDEPPTLPSAEELPVAATNTVPAEATQGDPTQMSPPTPPPASSGLENLIEDAKNDLAKRLLIPVDQISLIEANEVVWPDASLGCPQPGMAYIQVPEDGAQIILQAGGINYAYHTGGSRGLFLCETVFKEPNPPPKIDITKHVPPPIDSPPPGEDQ
jgi:hypothetical protein